MLHNQAMKTKKSNKRNRVQITLAVRPEDRQAFRSLLIEDDLFASQLFNRMVNTYRMHKEQSGCHETNA